MGRESLSKTSNYGGEAFDGVLAIGMAEHEEKLKGWTVELTIDKLIISKAARC